MKKDSKFTDLILILLAGMGNVKQGNWPGILIYFSIMILLGAALIFAEQTLIEQFYQPSQTLCTFAILIYITITFFWNGTNLLGDAEKKNFFNHDESIPAEKDQH